MTAKGPRSCPGLEADPVLADNYAKYMAWNPSGSAAVQAMGELAEKRDYETMRKLLNKRLTFGTAGIRGRMGIGFSQLNDLVIIQTTQGLGLYLLSLIGAEALRRGVVIGHDTRHNSSSWARLAASVLLRLGFKVYLFSSYTPTPWVPFTVQRRTASAGIMITASHNPKEDNGYKVFWMNGPQIKPPHDTGIQTFIMNSLSPIDGHAAFDFQPFLASHDHSSSPPLIQIGKEITQLYMYNLEKKLFSRAMNMAYEGRLVYTPVHGVGKRFVDEAFEAAGFAPLVHVDEQSEPDPDFPTVVFPNPEEGKNTLHLSIEKAVSVGSSYVVANDPDADRLAIAQDLGKEFSKWGFSNRWYIFNGNEIGTLIGWWLFHKHLQSHKEAKRENLYFIASTVSSKMLRAIAKAEKMNFKETLTGFKWMANCAQELEQCNVHLPPSDPDRKTVLLAYEEAIGYMCGTDVLDKDGVSAAVNVAEMIAYLDKEKTNLYDKLQKLYKLYGFHCSQNSYYLIHDPEVTNRIFERLRNFDGTKCTYPSKLVLGPGGDSVLQISSVRDLTTGYDSSRPPTYQAELPACPDVQMITFYLCNGTTVTLRTSGTEPKLKYYAEYCGKPSDSSNFEELKRQLSQTVQAFIKECIQPTENGLVTRQN